MPLDMPATDVSRPDGDMPATPAGPPPGIREQIGATVAAAKRLLRAHIDLAKAEAGEIVDEVKRMVALVGLALGLLFVVALLLALGLPLFVGEWLFGSLGWGLLLGIFLYLDLAAVAVLLVVGVSGRRLGSSFVLAAAIGIVVGLVLGLDLTHRGWTTLGESVAPNLDPFNRPMIVAVVGLALVLGALAFLARIRHGFGAAIGALIAGAIGGALLGLLTAATIPATVGAALGVWVVLIAWPAVAARRVMRTGIDGEALKQRFIPDQTIELTKETIEWVRARMPLAPKS